jgi:hypothetical protein
MANVRRFPVEIKVPRCLTALPALVTNKSVCLFIRTNDYQYSALCVGYLVSVATLLFFGAPRFRID